MEKNNHLTESHNLIDDDSVELNLCKICLTADKNKNTVTSKSIYTIIPNPNTQHCRCYRFSHDECLINWCLMKYSLQCPDCNIFYNMEIEKFVDETEYSFKYLFNILFYLISLGGSISLGINFLTYKNEIFTQVNEHWSLFLGITFILVFFGLIYIGIMHKKIFYQEKDYVFQIKLLPEDKTYDKIHSISKKFNFLLQKLFKNSSGDLFLSKIDETIFQRIDYRKKTEISNATKGRVNRAVSINLFVDINSQTIRRKNSSVAQIKKKFSTPIHFEPHQFLNRISNANNKSSLILSEKRPSDFSKTHTPRVKKVISTSINKKMEFLNHIIEEHPNEKSFEKEKYNGFEFSSDFDNQNSDDAQIFGDEDNDKLGKDKLDSAVMLLKEKINSINRSNVKKFTNTQESKKNGGIPNNNQETSSVIRSPLQVSIVKNRESKEVENIEIMVEKDKIIESFLNIERKDLEKESDIIKLNENNQNSHRNELAEANLNTLELKSSVNSARPISPIKQEMNIIFKENKLEINNDANQIKLKENIIENNFYKNETDKISEKDEEEDDINEEKSDKVKLLSEIKIDEINEKDKNGTNIQFSTKSVKSKDQINVQESLKSEKNNKSPQNDNILTINHTDIKSLPENVKEVVKQTKAEIKIPKKEIFHFQLLN